MSAATRYRPGDFYRICDRTGFKVPASETRTEWTGLIVRSQSWEPRNAQDFVRGVRDDQTVPNARPRQTDVFIVGTGEAEFMLFRSEATGLPSFLVQSDEGTSSIYVFRRLTPAPQDYPRSG